MIHNIFITSVNGIIYYTKDYSKKYEPKFANLVSTMYKSAKISVGKRMTFLQMESLSITLYADEEIGVICAIFHDSDLSYEFGTLMASNILSRFTQEYGVKFSAVDTNNKYGGFASKLPEIFRSLTEPIVKKLSKIRGIRHASLISTGTTYLQSTHTELSVSANLKLLLSTSTDMTTLMGDSPQMITLESDVKNIRVIQVVSNCSLIVMSDKKAKQDKIEESITKTIDLLQKLNLLITTTSK